jgi:hypothetical protein
MNKVFPFQTYIFFKNQDLHLKVAKKGGNYRENQVLQADSKGGGHYL